MWIFKQINTSFFDRRSLGSFILTFTQLFATRIKEIQMCPWMDITSLPYLSLVTRCSETQNKQYIIMNDYLMQWLTGWVNWSTWRQNLEKTGTLVLPETQTLPCPKNHNGIRSLVPRTQKKSLLQVIYFSNEMPCFNLPRWFKKLKKDISK